MFFTHVFQKRLVKHLFGGITTNNVVSLVSNSLNICNTVTKVTNYSENKYMDRLINYQKLCNIKYAFLAS